MATVRNDRRTGYVRFDMRSAVVFSAGGVAGWAYHAGVVGALRDKAGYDANSADLIIGTSAGSAIAAGVRAGLTADELLGPVQSPPTPEQRAKMMTYVKSRARKVRFLSPTLAHRATRNGAGWLLATSGILPDGFFPTWGLARFPGVQSHEVWPQGLYIPAASVDAAARVVFGRDVMHVSVADAVEASSAVPGMFEPKEIEGRRFIDGGTLSGTHAALAIDAKPDVVVISSLITRPARRVTSTHARRRLRDELGMLRDSDTPFLLIEPEHHLKDVLKGFPRREPERLDDILRIAQDDVERALLRSETVLS